MVIAAVLIVFAIFSFLLLRGAAQGRDRALEDQEQAEYLRAYALRKQKKH
ncbi:MAG: hypothetical protein SO355_08210 [Candidatus Faecousia sp.]|nr:hypothetical protein [Bacillota bacterium]MDY4755301.1 hypothetical protein [Candidatus Faecousia sp.]MDY6160387.1 hypothetical protein [Candidatus Faecousia sp.]